MTPVDLLNRFLFNKSLETKVNILLMFVFYLGNLVHGDRKPINSENQKFQTFIGVGSTSLEIMDIFGYTLVDKFFQPKPNIDVNTLKRLIEELSLQKDLLSYGSTNSSIFRFSEATYSIAKQLGASVPFQQPVQEFLLGFADVVKKSIGPYLLMGVLINTPDSVIMDCFEYLKGYDIYAIPRYLDAITDITQAKSSNVLEEYVLTHRSKGMVGERELTEAYKIFGQGFSDETHPKQIIEIYRYLCSVNPQQMDTLMNALRVIASHRDCYMLHNFVTTGDVSIGEHEQISLPAGLNNIGNTCYMNSLLQYYFSITSLREYVLAAKQVDSELDDMKENQSLKKALQFVLLLKKLFRDLIWSDSVSVTPEKKLAEIILSDSSGAYQFGEQQDLHECMDNVIDMFEIALKRCVNNDVLASSCTMLQK
jgi:ubiquitin carboxyl-terminal hydrolase 25/28